MCSIMLKEMKLSASPLSYLFILFGLMFFIPGYPILCGAFFVTFGIFQSFQTAREANDIVFSALLPIGKKDVVKGKYLFVCFIEACGLILMLIAVICRMTVFSDLSVYRNNALMNANLFALGISSFIFGLFNLIFVGGFFKTAYKFGGPFAMYSIAVFLTIGIGEALHHFPGLEVLNAFGFEHIGYQWIVLSAGIIIYLLFTMISYRTAYKNFEKIDL